MKVRNKVSGNEITFPQNATTMEAIVKKLSAEISRTTSELVEETGKNGCFAACKQLEQKGILQSMMGIKHTSWDPITRQVVTRENYDAIITRDIQAMEELRKRLKAEGLNDDEIEKKLRDVYSLRSIKVPFKTWWLSKDWEIAS